MNSIIENATHAVFYSEYSMDIEGRETWADELTHRAISLVDLTATLYAIVMHMVPVTPNCAFVWMAPRRLHRGITTALEQKSFAPLVYELAVLGSYPLVWGRLLLAYYSQLLTNIFGIIFPSAGAYGRNQMRSRLEQAAEEVKGEPAWSWRPNYDLLAEAMAHKAFFSGSFPRDALPVPIFFGAIFLLQMCVND